MNLMHNLTLTSQTNLGLIVAMGMVPQSQAPQGPQRSSKDLSQTRTRADHQNMEQVRSTDLFSKARGLIDDLIFDPWKPVKAVELRTILASLDPAGEVADDKDNAIDIILERVERLASLRVRGDKASTTSASDIFDRLSAGHDKLITFIESCFRVNG